MTANELFIQETERFIKWATPQGYLNTDANALVLAKWLEERQYPMTFDSLVSAFVQTKSLLEFKKVAPKKERPMNSSPYVGAGSTHSATRVSAEKGPLEEVQDNLRTIFGNIEKAAKGEFDKATTSPKIRRIPDDYEGNFKEFEPAEIKAFLRRKQDAARLEGERYDKA